VAVLCRSCDQPFFFLLLCYCVIVPPQVSDISQLGDPIAVANLVLPRGSTLLAASTQVVEQPAKETPLGPVDIPPQTYYA
jgi:hypothetical protein